MAILNATEQMFHTLDSFFASKTIQDIDRSSFLVCNLTDNRIKITISLVFMRDWDSLETDSYNSVIIENKGVVFTFPGYWVSIPKELALTYFEYVINEFYNSEVINWSIASKLIDNSNDNSNNGINGDGNDCSCNNIAPVKPQCPYNNFV